MHHFHKYMGIISQCVWPKTSEKDYLYSTHVDDVLATVADVAHTVLEVFTCQILDRGHKLTYSREISG